MLKEQLKQAALNFFTIPEQYKLYVEDVEDDKAMFLWKDDKYDEGYYVEFDKHGKLLSLSQPAVKSDVRLSIQEQQHIAEQFLISHYEGALHYYTLSNATKEEDRTCFRFEQFVGGYPLASSYCSIEIGHNGHVLDFNFQGYTKNPPSVPDKLVAKETILNKLFEAEWTANMAYLSTDSYTVPSSGLYVLYKSPIVYTTFDTDTGTNSVEQEPMDEIEESADNEVFVPIPIVAPVVREKTIEAIVGVTPTMAIVRQSEIDEDEHGIVWREKGFTAQSDKTMNSFIEDRIEQTVKATIQTSTNKLKGFVWFKERTGDLDLTFEACRDIAVAFITTYYREYIPYLQMKVEEPSFSSVYRAFFTFPITIDGYRLDSESFVMSVNKITGFIDMLMTPHLNISTIQAYTATPILKLFEAKRALTDVDAILEWTENYDSDEPQEILKYTFAHYKTQKSIRGINAVTGDLIMAMY